MTEDEWNACYKPEEMLAALGGEGSERKSLLFGVACCRRVWRLLRDERALRALDTLERAANTPDPGPPAAVRADLRAAVEDASWESYSAEADANFGTHPADTHAGALAAAVNAVGALYERATGDATVLYDWARGRPAHQHAALAVAADAESLALRAYRYDPPGWERGRRPHPFRVGQLVGRRVRWTEEEAQAAILRDILGPLPFRDIPFSPAFRTSAVTALATSMYESRCFDAAPILADALVEAGCCDGEVLGHLRGPGPHVRGCFAVDLALGRE